MSDKNTAPEKAKAAPAATAADTSTPAAPAEAKKFVYTDNEVTMALECPLPLGSGEQVITHVTVRRPYSGELRGLTMMDLLQIDVDTLIKLLPRITTPALHKAMTDFLDPADLTDLGKVVSGFFTGKKKRAEMLAEMEAAAAK